MTTDWYQQSMNALTLNGKGERTQEAYTRAVRMLVEFYAKRPEEITEAELEAYFLRRKNVDHWSANTMRICYCGIRFFFVQVLQRNWHLFRWNVDAASRPGRLLSADLLAAGRIARARSRRTPTSSSIC